MKIKNASHITHTHTFSSVLLCQRTENRRVVVLEKLLKPLPPAAARNASVLPLLCTSCKLPSLSTHNTRTSTRTRTRTQTIHGNTTHARAPCLALVGTLGIGLEVVGVDLRGSAMRQGVHHAKQ